MATESNSDPRGPRRIITATDNDPSRWYLTLDCGHIVTGTRHFWYAVGETKHCLQCRNDEQSN